ncbi:DUF4382 domain-containing protein [Cyanobacterium aponinum AL20118]|uniref:DUF4382 domain-containing protein n=1 Tax=Cyanobacterium aponinum TaxID=379064 RepID=UPI000C12BF56|nr:DUF4382 domain-containing protein [Cyanobacterium aponinum]PHV64138.1 DUF4382 domain-containing protein [Cyanobacterium aponinum IPPAS B-1201]WRL37796.1 DUF4382 domain-containing protein [Cyanobacterium aponinum UTEX 3221]
MKTLIIVKNWFNFSFVSFIAILFLSSCGNNSSNTTVSENEDSAGETLTLVANGEDFIRQGFTSKDGWRVDFNHAYVTLDEVIAYQTDPPFNAESDEMINASESIILVDEAITIDLAQGDENASPIIVAEAIAPTGVYNAISWKLINDAQSNSSIVLDGIAVKDGETINFVLNLPIPLEYQCGEFVGDERKGVLEAGKDAQLETTFHFDHIFGDGEATPEDEINVGAIGFQPLAQLSNNGELNIDLATMKAQLSPEDYEKLEKNLQSLGHVGEGHCRLVS